MFKRGDVVFLNKRGLFGNEITDPTNVLVKNKPYCVSSVKHDCVLLHPINMNGAIDGVLFHKDHFIKINDKVIQGINVFSIGDNVVLETTGKIGWESSDYSYSLLYDKIYTIAEYILDDAPCVQLSNMNCYFHCNHFKKV